MKNLSAESVAEILFTMTPVPTPQGMITGAKFEGVKLQFKYSDGTHGAWLEPTDSVEVSL